MPFSAKSSYAGIYNTDGCFNARIIRWRYLPDREGSEGMFQPIPNGLDTLSPCIHGHDSPGIKPGLFFRLRRLSGLKP